MLWGARTQEFGGARSHLIGTSPEVWKTCSRVVSMVCIAPSAPSPGGKTFTSDLVTRSSVLTRFPNPGVKGKVVAWFGAMYASANASTKAPCFQIGLCPNEYEVDEVCFSADVSMAKFLGCCGGSGGAAAGCAPGRSKQKSTCSATEHVLAYSCSRDHPYGSQL